MIKYGKVSANSLWHTSNGNIQYAFHNDTVVIKDEKRINNIEYVLCFFPKFNENFWVMKENIEW